MEHRVDARAEGQAGDQQGRQRGRARQAVGRGSQVVEDADAR
jgi:hypothetical protein